jgi:mannose-6-phosphate isomerase-like protein (cupin superfamily)
MVLINRLTVSFWHIWANPTEKRGHMLGTKVIVEELPTSGEDHEERRLFNTRGEMAQILNREVETFKHLVYWDLDTPKSGEERGHHYHERETEHFYIITGEAEILLEDLETSQKQTLHVKARSAIARFLSGRRSRMTPQIPTRTRL